MGVSFTERLPTGIDPEKGSPGKSAPISSAESLASPLVPGLAEVPDGGWKAWSVVFGGWCVLFASFGWVDCIGVFQTLYQTDQLRNYSPSTIAWITSVEVRI